MSVSGVTTAHDEHAIGTRYDEKNNGNDQINRLITPGGNLIDSTQPAFPIYHRK